MVLRSSITPAHTTKVTKYYLDGNSIKSVLILDRELKRTVSKIGHIYEVNLPFSNAVKFQKTVKLEWENVEILRCCLKTLEKPYKQFP